MKATEQQLQDIYEKAVSAECAEKQGVEMSSFDLLCALDEAGGVAHFIRSMIETVRAQKVKPVAFIDGNVSPADMDKLIQVITEMELIRDDMPFGLEPPLPEQPVSDSYTLPEEPTPAMQTAGASAIRFDTTPVNKLFTANAVWRAMRAELLKDK